jgi:hypothetical protein
MFLVERKGGMEERADRRLPKSTPTSHEESHRLREGLREESGPELLPG